MGSDLIDQSWFETAGSIYELPEGILHPLVDTTNGKLWSSCADVSDKIDQVKLLCEKVHNSQFFNPTPETIAVHMWTHVYLGWSILRSSYLASLYNRVERALPPTFQCPK